MRTPDEIVNEAERLLQAACPHVGGSGGRHKCRYCLAEYFPAHEPERHHEGCETFTVRYLLALYASEQAALREALRVALPFIEAIYREHGRNYLPNSGDAMELVQAALTQASSRPVPKEQEEFCLGCGVSTELRDCGCPAGTAWRQRAVTKESSRPVPKEQE